MHDRGKANEMNERAQQHKLIKDGLYSIVNVKQRDPIGVDGFIIFEPDEDKAREYAQEWFHRNYLHRERIAEIRITPASKKRSTSIASGLVDQKAIIPLPKK
jgi:hypothetical protein